MWGFFGRSEQESQLEKEKKRQEELLQQQLEILGLEEDLRKWKKDQETQEGLVNAARLQKEQQEREQKESDLQQVGDQATADDNTNGGKDTSQASDNQQTAEEMSYLEMAKVGFQELVNAFIRPPRATYEMEALGPMEFSFCGRQIVRTDSTLMTRRGYKLQCSHWIPVDFQTKIPVVIYMHGNASARVEVLPQLSHLLSLGISVFSFDFVGSGKSDGDYVSLGFFEREDLACVIKHLRSLDDDIISKIAVWGRSMGAATAIMYGGSNPDDHELSCMIVDSSFCDLVQVADELVAKVREEQKLNIPNFVTSVALRVIEGNVQQKAHFSIRDVSPISHVENCKIPALFVAGVQDDFIAKHHTEQLYENMVANNTCSWYKGGTMTHDHKSWWIQQRTFYGRIWRFPKIGPFQYQNTSTWPTLHGMT